jgi:Fe-S oxidoreductase
MTTIETSFPEKLGGAVGEALSLCYQCGTCTAVCPMNIPIRRLLRGAQFGIKDASYDDERLWYCATCRLCEYTCPRGVKVTEIIHALRVLGFQDRKAPPKLEQALWGVYEERNSWGGKKAERADWSKGLDLPEPKRRTKFVLYTGCAVSYDQRLQRVARYVVDILRRADVDFQTLGGKENCCGDVVYQVGEEGFLEELIAGNIKQFSEAGDTVVTLSPHCYNMFESVYAKYGKPLQALHYTQLLAELLDSGALKLEGERMSDGTVTYHDPCYLGRYHGIYEEPRKILESVPGLKLVEMKENKEAAICCGGGGGMMWTEFSGERPSRRRVTQASESGAAVLATSCPYCILNFEDALKTEGISTMKVADIAEVLHTATVKG